ncbi:uncharacterized protein [Watersipora subatra]|uniref:uncharacterized protein n=1 Tax=Watersipora subatra TaxID=2589382 RepID=UPI00355BFE9E
MRQKPKVPGRASAKRAARAAISSSQKSTAPRLVTHGKEKAIRKNNISKTGRRSERVSRKVAAGLTLRSNNKYRSKVDQNHSSRAAEMSVNVTQTLAEQEECVKAVRDIINSGKSDVLPRIRKLLEVEGHDDPVRTISRGRLTDLDPADPKRKLMQRAMDMREKAYCPYSNFRVGAALLSPDKAIYSGCNVENASYGLTICAERVAVGNAVANGCKRFEYAAVCCDVKDDFKGPCGACRQVLVEFSTDYSLYCVKPSGEYIEVPIDDLLPMSFRPSSLEEERVPTVKKL